MDWVIRHLKVGDASATMDGPDLTVLIHSRPIVPMTPTTTMVGCFIFSSIAFSSLPTLVLLSLLPPPHPFIVCGLSPHNLFHCLSLSLALLYSQLSFPSLVSGKMYPLTHTDTFSPASFFILYPLSLSLFISRAINVRVSASVSLSFTGYHLKWPWLPVGHFGRRFSSLFYAWHISWNAIHAYAQLRTTFCGPLFFIRIFSSLLTFFKLCMHCSLSLFLFSHFLCFASQIYPQVVFLCLTWLLFLPSHLWPPCHRRQRLLLLLDLGVCVLLFYSIEHLSLSLSLQVDTTLVRWRKRGKRKAKRE